LSSLLKALGGALQVVQPMLSTEIANSVEMTMAESWMTKVSAVMVEFLL
jgi:hypothetical protein